MSEILNWDVEKMAPSAESTTDMSPRLYARAATWRPRPDFVATNHWRNWTATQFTADQLRRPRIDRSHRILHRRLKACPRTVRAACLGSSCRSDPAPETSRTGSTIQRPPGTRLAAQRILSSTQERSWPKPTGPHDGRAVPDGFRFPEVAFAGNELPHRCYATGAGPSHPWCRNLLGLRASEEKP
jgi:hypothetical protein